MKILIDIGHPAHVHLFKHFAIDMQKKGHDILFTTREKEFEIELLKSNDFKYKSFGKKYKTTLGKIIGLFVFNQKMLRVFFSFRADIFISHGSMYAAQVAWLVRRPHITFEDTFNFEQIKLYKPFTKLILTSNYKHPYLGKNNLQYKGYHELAYLHPKRFTPNSDVLKELRLKEKEKFCIIRFVSWEATHDVNHTGISIENKVLLVQKLSKYAKVFISSEKPLPTNLQKYKFPLSPEKMHDAMAFAFLIFGESATMIAEGAVLGTPGVYLDDTGRLYTTELEEKYGLVINFSESIKDQIIAIEKAEEIIKMDNSDFFLSKREILLKDKIDVTGYLVWLIENYPQSVKILRDNPDFQEKFKN